MSDDCSVKLFKGTSPSRYGLPIVAKRHEVYFLENKPKFLSKLNSAISAGLAQARVDHAHSCKILDIVVDMDKKQSVYYVYHMLEGLQNDVGAELERRQEEKREFSEEELWSFLRQVGSALMYAHEKVRGR